MEPWLDSLSEDWNSLPRSNISVLSPQITAQSRPSSAKKAPTKIPRPKLSHVTDSPHLQPSPRATASERRRQGLSERRASDINITRPRTVSDGKQNAPLHSPYSSSPASKGSVVRHQHSTRRSRSSSPSKRKPYVTPEWKKLALRHAHEPSSQKDLFSPLPLEGLFQAPQKSLPRQTHGLPQPMSDMTMPSSPPPWPANHRGARKLFIPTKSRLSYGEFNLPSALGSQDNSDLVDELEPESRMVADGQIDDGLAQDADTAGHMDGTTMDETAESKEMADMGQPQITGNIANALQDAHDQLQSLVEEVSKSYISSDGANTASSSGFSPVFISKHNNVDGNVDYAALDTSNPAVVERLRQLATQSRAQGSRNPSGQSAADQSSHDPSTARSVVGINAQEAQTPEIVSISNFVSIKRGGLAEDDSFLRRPLSSSANSSLVPSDSVSQTFGRSQRGFGRSPLAAVARRARRSLSADAADERTPHTPDRAFVDGETGEIRHHQPSSPLKLFGIYDTFTNNRLLRRMSRLEDADKHEGEGQKSEESNEFVNATRTAEPISSSRVGKDGIILTNPFERTAETNHATPTIDNLWTVSLRKPSERSWDALDVDESAFQAEMGPRDYGTVKRPGSAPTKPPTPKRLRTLHEIDVDSRKATESTIDSEAVQERHQQMQAIIGKKRKDARYDQHPPQADPQELARRQIIQPRNLALQQLPNQSDQQLQLAQRMASTQSRLEVVQEHIEHISLPPGFSNGPIRALASEVASFRFQNPIILNGEVRKGSVSTQDYLDEAMKIMEMIRSRARPESGLAHPGPLMLQDTHEEDGLDTPLTISRPPSREGQPSVWRTRNDQELAPQLVSHLQQYQEADDESFMVESMTRSLNMIEQDEKPEKIQTESEPPNVRISQPIRPQEDDLSTVVAPLEQMTQRTHSSRPSTDSTGRTIGTTSSQRTRNLAVIAPDKVSHLISGEEAGMRFDTEKNIWVKFKPRQASDSEGKGSSSTVEEDPFDHIPDLSVNESEEHVRIYSTYRNNNEIRQDFHEPDNDSQGLSTVESAPTTNGGHGSKSSGHEAEYQQYHPLEVTPDDSAEEDSCEVPTTDPLPVYPSDTVRSKQRRDFSVLFSSPVVTYMQDADEWHEEDSAMLESYDDDDDDDDEVEELDSPPEPVRRVSSRHLQSSVVRRHFDPRNPNFPVAEQREVSLIETRPDGRTMSLTLSVSTPVQRTKWSNRRPHANSQAVNRYATYSLSPLSEFTMHQDDAQHLHTTNLTKGLRPASKPQPQEHTALAVSRLVEKITDAEPSELFWDSMHSLKLKAKDLDSVVMLDELCPELEALDIGANRLSQLVGVPASVRHLDAQFNRLDNLTTWGHLRNLQYLNISGNTLLNCNGFSELIHLRELKADHCQITDVEGLFDLDGLLNLSLKGNALQELDFSTSMMHRLSSLNVSDNAIVSIAGLDNLTELVSLDLSGNKLASFRSGESTSVLALESLDLSRNCLSSLSVAQLHSLRALYADGNHLASIHGIADLQCLSTLSLRNQSLPANDSVGFNLPAFSNLHHLYLSNNSIADLHLDDTPFLNLQTLDVSCTGLQTLPSDLNTLCPNLRTLNLNSNSLKTIKHLHGLRKLRTLHAAGNRLSRLRRTLAIVASLPELQELDLRDNPLTLGMYAPAVSQLQVQALTPATVINGLMHTLAAADVAFDAIHETRLDEPTRLRRRVYALLLSANVRSHKPSQEIATRQGNGNIKTQGLCLKSVDGLPIEAWYELAHRRDAVWEQLVDVGVIERVDDQVAN